MQDCHEYICGGCTKTLFYVDGLTRKCRNYHNEEKRKDHLETASIKYDYELDVLKIYENIIQENERKQINNNKLLFRINQYKSTEDILELLEIVDKEFKENYN
ncbi:hypothetical protein SLOPH_2729, partial [Spraguea lophii 42_110]